jgi:hypothetical protein
MSGDHLDELLDAMAFADAVRACRGEKVTPDEAAHVFWALRSAAGDRG